MKGIYCYEEIKTGEIVYIGKDSTIDKNTRCRQHFQKCRYSHQPINRVLQNNRGKYQYRILKQGDFSQELLNVLEILYIRRYSPKFNYTIGGEFTAKKRLSLEHRKKISQANKGKNHHMYGKCHTDETKEKISLALKGNQNNPSKYSLWDIHQVRFKKDGFDESFPLKIVFRCKYNNKELPIGQFNEFVSCEIINSLIVEAIQ